MYFLTVLVFACFINIRLTSSQICTNELKPQFWIRKLGLHGYGGLSPPTALIKIIYQSREPLGHHKISSGLSDTFGSEAVLTQFYSIYGKQQLLSFRRSNIRQWFHFYHGDMIVVHTLNPKTGEYKTLELGGRSLRYFMIMPPDMYFALDIHEHTEGKYALIGFAIFHPDASIIPTYGFAGKEEMLDKFPQHSGIIDRFYLNLS